MDEDLSLLDSWSAGDSRAGQALFKKYFNELYRFFEHKVGAEADDLVQRTFMGCIGARDRFRGQSSYRTYLFAIARNQLYTHLRKLPKGEHVDFEVTSIAAIVTSLSSQIGRLREIEQLRIALAALPAEQQLLLELHYWHDLDAEALGEVFEAAPGTMRVRLLRARKALRLQMGQAPHDAGSADGLIRALSRPDSED